MTTSPILIYDGGDFIFFNNIKDVGVYLEVYDIEDDKILVFDSSQQLLKFIVQKGKWFDKVVYFGVEEKDSELDLRYSLARYIARRANDITYLDAPWDNLISFVTEHLLPKK